MAFPFVEKKNSRLKPSCSRNPRYWDSYVSANSTDADQIAPVLRQEQSDQGLHLQVLNGISFMILQSTLRPPH